MEAHDIKETWKAGVEKNIKPYPEEKLNEMIIKSARKSIKTVYPGTVFRLVVVAVVVYLIVMLFIREQSMERAYVDIAALAVLSVEKSVKFNTKYGWIVYTCSFLSAIGFYVFYLMAMNITPGILNVVVVPLGIAIYLLIIDRSLGRNYRKTLRELKDLYKQFEVED